MLSQSTIKVCKNGETAIGLSPVVNVIKCHCTKSTTQTEPSIKPSTDITILQTTGDSTTAVMSQKATTDAINNISVDIDVATTKEINEYLGI